LTVGFLGILANTGRSILTLIPLFFLNMGIGLIMGYIMARVSVYTLNKIELEYEGLYPVLTIGLVLITYSVTTLIKGSGFLAVYFLGLLMSKEDFVHKRSLLKFYEGVAWLMQILMFLALGMLVFPSQIVPIIGSGLLIAAILMFVASAGKRIFLPVAF